AAELPRWATTIMCGAPLSRCRSQSRWCGSPTGGAGELPATLGVHGRTCGGLWATSATVRALFIPRTVRPSDGQGCRCLRCLPGVPPVLGVAVHLPSRGSVSYLTG